MTPELLAVHSLDRFEVALPDLAEAERFYSTFGLDVRRTQRGLSIAPHGSDHRVFDVVAGGQKKLCALTFGIHAEDVERFARRIAGLSIDAERVSRADGSSLRFRDPDGTSIELRVAPKTSPSTPNDPPVARTKAPSRAQAPSVRPARFSHILLFTSDVDRACRFYAEVLGLRLSDRSGNDIAFMHSPHGSDHHLVAFVRSTGPGLHHSSWDVRSIDEVGLGARQLAVGGYDRGWGVGRHVLGSNYFYYARDPWGGFAEYSFDMDFIARDTPWVAGDHHGEDSFFVWGPQPPKGFEDNTEVA